MIILCHTAIVTTCYSIYAGWQPDVFNIHTFPWFFIMVTYKYGLRGSFRSGFVNPDRLSGVPSYAWFIGWTNSGLCSSRRVSQFSGVWLALDVWRWSSKTTKSVRSDKTYLVWAVFLTQFKNRKTGAVKVPLRKGVGQLRGHRGKRRRRERGESRKKGGILGYLCPPPSSTDVERSHMVPIWPNGLKKSRVRRRKMGMCACWSSGGFRSEIWANRSFS